MQLLSPIGQSRSATTLEAHRFRGQLFEKQPKGSVEHPRTVEGKSVERNASAAPVAPVTRAIPLSFIFLVAVAVHLPLLLMELPLKTFDTNFHIFFASHYLHHWFDPWNP